MVELVVNGSKIETSTGTDLTIVLNKSIADFDDISARSSSYSFDFELPPTQTNNVLLFGVSDVNAFRDVNIVDGVTIGDVGRVQAILLVDGLEYDRGTLFAFESQLDGNYTATYQSGLISWSDEISNLRLNQLKWRGVADSNTVTAQETFTSKRISILNAGDSDTYDFIYPYVNRNNDGSTELQRPQIYLRSFINNLFNTVGWTVDGTFLELDEIKGGVTIQDRFSNDFEFKGVTIDPPFNFEVDADIITTTLANYGSDKISVNLNSLVGNFNVPATPNNILTSSLLDFFDQRITDNNLLTPPDFLFDSSTASYTATGDYKYTINFNPTILHQLYVNGSYTSSTLVTGGKCKINLLVYVDGVLKVRESINDAQDPNGKQVEVEVDALNGDLINIKIEMESVSVTNATFSQQEMNLRRTFLLTPSSVLFSRKNTIDLGENFVINNHIADLNCLELLQDIKLANNLIFRTDDKNKVVTIDKWEAFYQNIGVAKNYTDKLDLSEPPMISHLSDYSREIVFKYKEDTSDGYLNRWQKINERIYGRYRQDLIPSNKFEDGQNTFETKLISPSIQGTLNGSGILVSMSRTEFELEKEEGFNTGYNTRMYYTVRGKQYFNDGTERSGFTITTSMMESYGNVPMLDDNQLTFNGANGLIARNWTKTLATIQLGIRVNCKFLLSKYEFFNFDFRFPIFLEYPSKLKGYYLVESLNNFEVTDNNLYSTDVALIKYKDFVGVTIDTSQGTNINENANNNQSDAKTIVYTITDEGGVNETINRVYTIAGNGEIQNVII